ncbi:hypothetical protein Hamer_G020666 [Homarus americanus]|uniref:Uncharacterized protein n=1 Tax=Homarus americanus TaxID=6706 RepID=A0A8J5KHQ9_HOMAM|nr:hypothetical protein Hamer_G020666 [Homarus americanus]
MTHEDKWSTARHRHCSVSPPPLATARLSWCYNPSPFVAKVARIVGAAGRGAVVVGGVEGWWY